MEGMTQSESCVRRNKIPLGRVLNIVKEEVCMKRIALICLAIGVLGVGWAHAADQGCKIGLIDMQKFQQKSNAFQKVRIKLEKKFSDLKKKLDKEKQSIAKLEEELKKQSMMLSLDAKEDKQRELKKKKRYYKYLYNELTEEMREAEQDAKRMVAKDVEKIVGEIGEREGYTVIFEKGTIGLVYYKDSIDITDQVVAAYDKLKAGK